MKTTLIASLKLLLLLTLAMATAQLRAASLLLDFGPTVVVPSDATSSLGHFSGAVPSAEITWNTVTADIGSGLLYSDGTAATGISVKLGRSDFGMSNSVDFNTTSPITSSALGGQLNTNIYAGTSPVKDGLFAAGTTSVFTNVLGIRINGLSAGTYTLYISGRNTSTAVTASERFFCTNGPSASSFSFSTNSTPSVDEQNSATAPGGTPNSADALTSTFGYGDNGVLMTVTINTNDSIFLAATGIAVNEARGFLNSVEIVSGPPVTTNLSALILKQPANQTIYEGNTLAITNVRYAGYPPLSYQWKLNGNNVSGATNAAIAIPNARASMSGNYTVTASNPVAPVTSSNALVTIFPLDNTGQMTNIWNLLPGERFYITVTNNTSGERGLAYNPVTSNLLVVCQLPSNNIVALDPATGAEKYFMNLSGVPAGAAGVNTIGVAGDGVVYAGNATANAGSASTPYTLWQWANDDSNSVPAQLLSGDPGFGTAATGLRWGDNIAVRGAGVGTQILIAPGSGTNVCLFTTPDGVTFFPAILTISNVPSGFGQFGVSFGPGTNTFWAKTFNQQLYLVQFDPISNTGDVLASYSSTNGVPNSFRFISTDSSQKWLAGVTSVAAGLPDNVRLYDISNLTNGPVLADQELYTTMNPNTFLGSGTGYTAFGGNYLFALNSQNGIKAFLIETNFSGALNSFNITSATAQAGTNFVLSWPSVSGHTYQVQAKTSLSDSTWTNVGSAVVASSAFTSATNAISGAHQFYRIQGQ